MAYTRTYYFDFASLNGYTYRLEFYDQITVTTNLQNKEGKLGSNPCQITYGSDGSDFMAPIKASTLDIQFIVRGTLDAQYIKLLRTERAERDVYVYLYRETVVGTANPTQAPIWAGYLLMDLSDSKDEFFPSIVKLKAVDGIASLKYYDFVLDSTTQNPEHLYTRDETFIATDTNGEPLYRNFIMWIVKALEYAGVGTSTQGRKGIAPFIRTSVEWFHQDMPNLTINPLDYTRVQAYQFYQKQESSGTTYYKAKSTYDVIKAICKAWGMRFLQWRGQYIFLQVEMYRYDETGTASSPDNIRSIIYDMAGAQTNVTDHLGTWWTKYKINLGSGYSNYDSGFQKLEGGSYGLLEKYKKVTVDFKTASDNNLFTEFPVFKSPWYTNNQLQKEYTSLGIFNGLDTGDQVWYQQIWLNFINNTGGPSRVRLNWWIVARPSGSATWTRVLSYDQSPSVQDYVWANMGVFLPGIEYSGLSDIDLPIGHSKWEIGGATVIPGVGNWIPFDGIGISGDVEIGYLTFTNTLSNVAKPLNHGKVGIPPVHTYPQYVNYTNTIPGGGPQTSFVVPIDSGVVGVGNTVTSIYQAGDDTAFKDVKDILWGDIDAPNAQHAAGTLYVKDGSGDWNPSGLIGEWGRNSLAGSRTFTELLAREYLRRQAKHVKTLTIAGAQGERDKYASWPGALGAQRPNYPGPLSKFVEAASYSEPETEYIMHSGKFNIAADEWELELYEFQDFSLTVTTTTTTGPGEYTAVVGGPSINTQIALPSAAPGTGRIIGTENLQISQLPQNNRRLISGTQLTRISASIDVDNTSATITGVAVTSLTIQPIGTAILKSGDKIALIPKASRIDEDHLALTPAYYTFTLSADQGASDTTLSVVSQTIYNYISEGDVITLDSQDLVSQYQNKTEGTIGGMAIGTDTIDSAKALGREYISMRCEGLNFVIGDYYIYYGEDNNKSGRMGQENANAPTSITAQLALKGGRYYCDNNFEIESGRVAISGTNSASFTITLYKVTPEDDSSEDLTMTSIATVTIATAGNTTAKIGTFTDLSTATIAAGDIIVPHAVSASVASADFRGIISFTLIRK